MHTVLVNTFYNVTGPILHTRIQNTRRQDQRADFHPHTASAHMGNDYASMNAQNLHLLYTLSLI
jgi:hypothetical protein